MIALRIHLAIAKLNPRNKHAELITIGAPGYEQTVIMITPK
jgi:hypothetical protein